MKPIAEFDGYMGGLAVIKWTGETRLAAGDKLYALPVMDRAPVVDKIFARPKQEYLSEPPATENVSGPPLMIGARTASVLPVQAQQVASDAEFKNFHRSLCERFGYTHDEIDWKRDQVSLIEYIAALAATQPAAAPADLPPGAATLMRAGHTRDEAITLTAAPAAAQGEQDDKAARWESLYYAAVAATEAAQANTAIAMRLLAASKVQPANQAGDAKDAARYRFIKTMPKQMLLFWMGAYGRDDAAIDAAMAQQADGGGA